MKSIISGKLLSLKENKKYATNDLKNDDEEDFNFVENYYIDKNNGLIKVKKNFLLCQMKYYYLFLKQNQ